MRRKDGCAVDKYRARTAAAKDGERDEQARGGTQYGTGNGTD